MLTFTKIARTFHLDLKMLGCTTKTIQDQHMMEYFFLEEKIVSMYQITEIFSSSGVLHYIVIPVQGLQLWFWTVVVSSTQTTIRDNMSVNCHLINLLGDFCWWSSSPSNHTPLLLFFFLAASFLFKYLLRRNMEATLLIKSWMTLHCVVFHLTLQCWTEMIENWGTWAHRCSINPKNMINFRAKFWCFEQRQIKPESDVPPDVCTDPASLQ